MKTHRRVKNHTLGEVRYFTYWLEFPDGEVWVDQSPFVGPLDTLLPLTRFKNRIDICNRLRAGGEAHWKDNNGVGHRLKVEEIERTTNWGVRRKR